MRTVRDATLQVARDLGLTTWFGNPGSTEIPLLADLPDGIRYLLALHENAAVGMAAGQAIATGRPALVSLRPWYSGPQAAQITAAIAQAEAAMQRAAQSEESRTRPAATPFQYREEIPS